MLLLLFLLFSVGISREYSKAFPDELWSLIPFPVRLYNQVFFAALACFVGARKMVICSISDALTLALFFRDWSPESARNL